MTLQRNKGEIVQMVLQQWMSAKLAQYSKEEYGAVIELYKNLKNINHLGLKKSLSMSILLAEPHLLLSGLTEDYDTNPI